VFVLGADRAVVVASFAMAACSQGHLQQHQDFDSGPPPPVCGNNVIQPGQQCNGTNLDGQTCKTLGYISGSLACSPTCQFDTSGCSRICGNGQCDALKQCDGTNLCGHTCAQWGFYSCDATCNLVTTSCVPTLFNVSPAVASTLNLPIVRFGKALTATWMDLAIAVPAGNPGPVVQIDGYDSAVIFSPERTLGISQGFQPPFLYQEVIGHGYTDVLLASATGTGVLLYWWDPSNQLFQSITTPLGCAVQEYAVADLNNDGKPDIVVSCGSPSQQIGILAGGQTSPFSMVTWLASINEPIQGIQVAVTGNSANPDIVFRRINTNDLGVLAGDGKLGFTLLPDSAVGNVVGQPYLVDLDLDGKPDLTVVDVSNLKLHLYPGTGVLTFGSSVDIDTVGTPIGMHIKDIDLDGLPDISFASQPGSIAALKNLGSAGTARFNFRRQDTAVTGIGLFTSFDLGDYDQDGDLDAMVGGAVNSDGGGGGLIVFLSNNVL
jgi:hypothetical protein